MSFYGHLTIPRIYFLSLSLSLFLHGVDEPYVAGPRNKFFPPLASFDPPYPIAPDGYLPNSAILQQLRKSEEDRLLAERWKPPTLSDKQRKLMEEMKQVQ